MTPQPSSLCILADIEKKRLKLKYSYGWDTRDVFLLVNFIRNTTVWKIQTRVYPLHTAENDSYVMYTNYSETWVFRIQAYLFGPFFSKNGCLMSIQAVKYRSWTPLGLTFSTHNSVFYVLCIPAFSGLPQYCPLYYAAAMDIEHVLL